MLVRRRYVFKGNVQGVGFRYRANYAAQGLGVTGFVYNEWDGSVVMEAQGSEDMLNRLLTLINQGSYISIDWIDTTDLPVDEDERSFSIR
ncbi:MAG: acylphosphatase [Butyrivibrio sp.]|nr:acylphosphatase [Butyrivibrio sp.]